MVTDYTAVDAAILAYLERGCGKFSAIWYHALKAAKPIAPRDKRGRLGTERVVERRLQALRKAGRIQYTRRLYGGGYRWRLVAPQEAR